MEFIIDRFEGEYAVIELEAKQFVNLPRKMLPPECAEGDTIQITKVETDRKEKIENLMNSLFED